MKAWFLFALFLTPAFALADSIEIRDIEEGEGPELVRHDTALVHYVGRLEEDGSEFDSSRGGQPLSVTIGSGQTIPGFEQAVKGMREGGKREAIIPPELAYGERGAGNIIPPNATLRFELEVVEVQRAPFSSLDNEGLAEKLDEGVTIVDIRRPDEWAETGVVEGSHRITAFEEDGSLNPEFGSKFTALVDSDDEVILICRVGNRTSALAQALSEGLGYDKIYNVTDGIMEWLDDDRVVRHDCPDHEETAQC
ncbi:MULTISPECIES: FKBP-type peptidyl-prolyl cis-trans isomerase [unclassified Thioalkalivibrio]|uniref:FKBP-type peptidyl-prolyl cis-trans isomerase n=1 Tax=unclassified Thioalkalivibrio TaxID=2621013 RepID=UPI00036E90F8|nr:MULTISPECIES: FKBP-type peptidyl-prolyl cis-trans isomerase [unclassified Thioalkalivibrio]